MANEDLKQAAEAFLARYNEFGPREREYIATDMAAFAAEQIKLARDAEPTEYQAAIDERERLRAALEWYGENARLCRLIHREGDAGRTALSADGGAIAREALKTNG